MWAVLERFFESLLVPCGASSDVTFSDVSVKDSSNHCLFLWSFPKCNFSRCNWLQRKCHIVRRSRAPTSNMKRSNSICETNYSSCTITRSENIFSSSGGTHEKRKTIWNSVYHQNWWFSEFHPPLNASVHSSTFFAGFFFESHPVYDQTQGSGGAVFFFLYTDNSWAAHMILKTLASAWPAPWNSLAESEAGRQNAHIRSIMFFSISSKFDRLLRRSTHRINWNTPPLSMPPAVSQALAVLPQIISHHSIHGQFALTCAGFFMLLFQLIKFHPHFMYFGLNLSPIARRGQWKCLLNPQ